jgi:hypothetical protein
LLHFDIEKKTSLSELLMALLLLDIHDINAPQYIISRGTSQGPELHPDVSALWTHVLLLDVSSTDA